MTPASMLACGSSMMAIRVKIREESFAVWRLFDRRNISYKNTLYAEEQKRADIARARRPWMREQGNCYGYVVPMGRLIIRCSPENVGSPTRLASSMD